MLQREPHQETEQQFRLIADSAPVPMWVTSLDRKRSFVNRAYVDFLGVSYEEAVDFDWRRVIHPDDLAQILAQSVAGEASLETFTLLGRYHRGDGEWRWLHSVSQPRWGPDGEHVGFIGVAHDVTEAKEAEQALRASETRLRFLDQLNRQTAGSQNAGEILSITARLVGEHLHISNCAYADMDEDEDGFFIRGDWTAEGSPTIVGHYQLADFGQLAVRNLKAGEPLVINDNLSELDPAEAATFQNIGIAATICMPLIKNGRLTALMAVHDKVPRIWSPNEVALLREVTERSWAHVERVSIEADLRASEARLRALNSDLERQVIERTQARGKSWQLSPDLMGAVNAGGNFETSNPAWKSILGWDEDEITAMAFFDLLHPDDRESSRLGFERIKQGEPAMHYQNRFRCKDGSYRWLSWVGVPDEGLVYFTGRDITEEKDREEQLRLAQEALRQSQKLEAMGQLTGGVAHDFNNLLTPIMGSLDLLHRNGVGDERERRLIEGALLSADRAKTLVQRLLAFARRQPLVAAPVDIAGLASGMLELISSTLGPAIAVELDLPQGLPPAMADAHQLEMALLNLAVNARDAMPEGGMFKIGLREVRIGEGAGHRCEPGTYLCLTVSDTGVGMDEDTRKSAIEPFFSTKGIGKGTGLGLSMVHGLALQLGGDLTLKSEPGAGTEVSLWLQVSPDAARPAPHVTQSPEFSAPTKTALVVDDELLVLMCTVDMIGELGFAVAEAGSAEQALEMIEGGLRPDILVTDHLMPGLTGVELARRAVAAIPGLAVLIVSGYSNMDGLDPEFGTLTKPFMQSDLKGAVASLMGPRFPGEPGDA